MLLLKRRVKKHQKIMSQIGDNLYTLRWLQRKTVSTVSQETQLERSVIEGIEDKTAPTISLDDILTLALYYEKTMTPETHKELEAIIADLTKQTMISIFTEQTFLQEEAFVESLSDSKFACKTQTQTIH